MLRSVYVPGCDWKGRVSPGGTCPERYMVRLILYNTKDVSTTVGSFSFEQPRLLKNKIAEKC